MDVVTHAMIGTALAGPLLPVAPLTASSFVLGSVLPDLDALSRLCGKVAFLQGHQTYTHAIPIILATTALAWGGSRWLEVEEPWAALALGAGMLLHALLDATNTYGVALWAPCSRRRYCTEWIFFIDTIVIVLSIGFLALVVWQISSAVPWGGSISALYGSLLLGYVLVRAWLHRRAQKLAPPDTRSLIPSALLPWRFFGYAEHEGEVRLFDLDILNGTLRPRGARRTFDHRFQPWLSEVAEYRLMRALSRGYWATEAREHDAQIELVCCDLRIRNFGGHFGRLELVFDTTGKVLKKVFHV